MHELWGCQDIPKDLIPSNTSMRNPRDLEEWLVSFGDAQGQGTVVVGSGHLTELHSHVTSDIKILKNPNWRRRWEASTIHGTNHQL